MSLLRLLVIPPLFVLLCTGVHTLGVDGDVSGQTALGAQNLTVQMEFDPAALGLGVLFSQIVLGGIAAYDTDDDGVVEILLNYRKNEDRIVCISGADMSIEWVYPPMDQEGLVGDPMCNPAIGDMDNDGKVEIVFPTRGGNLYCIDGMGNPRWVHESEGIDSSATLYDIDGDGDLEAVWNTRSGKVCAVDHTGQLVWSHNMAESGTVVNSMVTAFDVDQDGFVEVLALDGAGNVYCFCPTRGIEKWRFTTGNRFYQTAPVIGDIDNDGEYEILVQSQDRYLYCLTAIGQEIWRFPVGKYMWNTTDNDAGKHEGGIALGDIDGDGVLEVFASDWVGNLYCVEANGTERWFFKFPGEIWNGILLGDVGGDERIDVVCGSSENEAAGYPDGLLAVLDNEGNLVYQWALSLGCSGGIGDFNGDGYTDLFVHSWGDPDLPGQGYLFRAVHEGIRPVHDPNTMIWPYRYRTLTNNAVVPITCPNRFPVLWSKVIDRFPLARASIDAARRKGIDPSIIDVMEMEYTNAEKARDMCDLESAQIHLDWIMQAAPEPHTVLVAILLLPIYLARLGAREHGGDVPWRADCTSWITFDGR